MFSGFQILDGFRRNMFNGLPTKISDNKTTGSGYPFAWFRADLGITKDGEDYVSEWKDKDGRDYSFLQATQSKKPSFKTGINGQNSILFDRTDDFLDLTKAFSIKDFFIVQKYAGINTTYEEYMCSLHKDSTSEYIIEGIKNSTNLANNGILGKDLFVDNKYQLDTAPIQNMHIIEGKSINNVNISSFMRLGARYGQDMGWLGYISELLLFKEYLTKEQTDYWANYLAVRYNITLQG